MNKKLLIFTKNNYEFSVRIINFDLNRLNFPISLDSETVLNAKDILFIFLIDRVAKDITSWDSKNGIQYFEPNSDLYNKLRSLSVKGAI